MRPIVTGLLLSTMAGCAVPRLSLWDQDAFPRASAQNPVTRVVCIWEPAEGTGLDGLPTRGCAGQILFFTRGEPSPVQVEGDVRIYLFDDGGTPEEQAKPIHQFDFLGDAWTVHLSKSTLGASYNVFIPYVRKHGRRINCALRVRFTPAEGAVVYSDSTHITLPGTQDARLPEEIPQSAAAALRPAGDPATAPLQMPLQATLRRRTISPGRPQIEQTASQLPSSTAVPGAGHAVSTVGTPAESADPSPGPRPSDPGVGQLRTPSRRFRLAAAAADTENAE